MEILGTLPDGRERARLADDRLVVLSPVDKNGDRAIMNEAGEPVGNLQRLFRNHQFVVYLFLEDVGSRTKILLEIILEDFAEEYQRLYEEYGWVFDESEGGPTIKRLFDLGGDPQYLRHLFDSFKSGKQEKRAGKWAVLKKIIHLIDHPELRTRGSNLAFWYDKCLPLLELLHIDLP